jgi:sugar phosphate isomerase/epimerase
MRDFSENHRWLSLNTATVRKQGNLVEIIEACARHGIRAIDPWRDQVAHVGLDRAARAVRDAGLELSGYCRGGMFTSDAAHRIEARDDNRRAVDEAKALGAPCIVLVAGGLPQYSRPGSAATRDIAQARTQVHDGIAEMLEYAVQVNMPLAIEPLHPAYAADRACVNTGYPPRTAASTDTQHPHPTSRPAAPAIYAPRPRSTPANTSRHYAPALDGSSP